MKMLTACVLFLTLAGVGYGQKAAAVKPPPDQSAKVVALPEPPKLTDAQKTSILFVQRQQFQFALQLQNLEKQYNQKLQELADEQNKIIADIEKSLGGDWKVDPDALTVSAKPKPAPEPEPAKK